MLWRPASRIRHTRAVHEDVQPVACSPGRAHARRPGTGRVTPLETAPILRDLAKPWQTLHTVSTDEGPLELRQRGPRDFLIVVDGRVLMSSAAHRSELDVARAACARLDPADPAPRVLIGGLGMGYTLRAALDDLPPGAEVVVAELNPVVVDWCRGPLAVLTDDALADPRASVEVADVADLVRRGAKRSDQRWSAIVLDLYEGPHAAVQPDDDPFYGARALRDTARALRAGGVFSVWSEERDHAFERRLARGGFDVEVRRPGKGGRRHAVYVATPRH